MRRLAALVLVLVPLLAAGIAVPASAETTRQDRIRQVKQVALRQIGDRYRYGAEGPTRFDCSGLVYFSARRAGFDAIPRTSSQQARYMRRIDRSAMRSGDFVFFTGRHGVYHVGVYLGRRDGRRMIVHAPSPGTKVRRDPVWTSRWFAGTLRRR